MPIDEQIRAGRLDEALAAAIAAVRAAPADGAARLLLGQLFMVTGAWERALTQWKMVGELDPDSALLAKTCEALIHREDERRAVFAGEKLPLVLGEPEPWTAGLFQALRLDAAGHFVEARKVQEEALESAPASGGKVNGESFEWIADADSRLGPMLEAVIDGRYFWVPFHRIASLASEPPGTLRDLVWMPVHFVWTNGGKAAGYVPVRYPFASPPADAATLLARRTDWDEPAEGWFHGRGQRMLATDQNNYALLDVRLLELTAAAATTAHA